MTAPSQMFEHFLDPLKGWWDWACLNFVAKQSADVEFDIPAGRVVHLNSSGEFVTGQSGVTMPMFLFTGSAAFDVNVPSGTTAAGTFVSQPILPSGEMMALVATGGYELSSTEYDTTKTYAVNDLLTAHPADDDSAVGGVLTNVKVGGGGSTTYIDPICGVVSKIGQRNEYNVRVLHFWTVYLPASND